MEKKVEKITPLRIALFSLMWAVLIGVSIATCGRRGEIRPERSIIISDDYIVLHDSSLIILPQRDTMTYLIVGPVDDNTLKIYCTTDSTVQFMKVESAYTPEYYEGIEFKIIKQR